MSVSVSMPQLGESVTEGTVTRWLKKEGERVEADEPLLEVSTDKVDTEIPSPAAGVLRNIAVGEDETVEVGAQLAEIEESADTGGYGAPSGPAESGQTPAASDGSAAETPGGYGDAGTNGTAASQLGGYSGGSAGPSAPTWSSPAQPAAPQPAQSQPAQSQPTQPQPTQPQPTQSRPTQSQPQPAQPAQSQPAQSQPAQPQQQPQPAASQQQQYAAPPQYAPPQYAPSQYAAPPQYADPQPTAQQAPAPAVAPGQGGQYATPTPLPTGGDGPYVTPLVRKLASEHGVDLESLSGTGVGGRIRKQDVLDAARTRREAEATRPPAPPAPAATPAASAPPAPVQAGGSVARPAAGRPPIVPSALRGTTQRMSRSRQVIAQRMVESLQTSAQLTTVVEADLTAIARLRARARGDFEAREGVKLTFLPFFALAAVEALKVYPTLNAVIDAASNQVTYHDAEHLGIAVDTERGLTVPVIHNAGDLNLGGLSRKIADLAARTRSGQVSVDELSGGTFTLTNTGSRGALFDTPIINQPQVAILGTGTVVKRAVVVEDPALGEVIAVRSMVYLALTYDHRLVDGADAARFLTTVKERLEEGSFEAELGL